MVVFLFCFVFFLQNTYNASYDTEKAGVEHRELSSVPYGGLEGWDEVCEGGSRGKVYMYMYVWFTLLYSRNEHNIVNQLYSNNKVKWSFYNKEMLV